MYQELISKDWAITITIYHLFLYWIGLTIGNYISVYFSHKNYKIAQDISFFQGVAYIVIWVMSKI